MYDQFSNLPLGQRVVSGIIGALSPLTSFLGPYVGDSWAYTPASTVIHLYVFGLSVLLWSRLLKVDAKKVPMLSATMMSSFHALLCVLAAYPELAAWNPSISGLDAPNTPIQALQLQFSLGYLLADTVYMVVFTPNDYLFLGHHALAGLYLFACLHHHAGAISALLIFFMGEITGPLFSAFSISKELRHDSPLAARMFALLSPVFTVAFVLVRSVISPIVIGWFLHALCFKSAGIPFAWRVFMGSLVVAGMAGSQLWSFKLIRGFLKARRRDAQAGKKKN